MTDTTPEPGTDVARMPSGSLDERIRYAQTLAMAGDLIPAGLRDGRQANPGKVLLAVETGAMLGIHPVAAINGVNIIDGKATISPALMSGIVRKAGHKLRVRTTGTLEAGDLAVVATLIRADDPDEPFTATWTPARAARAGLCKYDRGEDGQWHVRARSQRGGPLPWESYTEAMLKARAIGEVCREGAEDALMGVHYTPEELGATVDADGSVVSLGEVPATHDRPAEPTPEQYAAQVAGRMVGATTKVAMNEVWKSAAAGIRFSWASQFPGMRAFAEAQTVTVPIGGTEATLSLFDAFVAMSADLPEAAQPDPEPAGGEDIVDAEVVEETPATSTRPTGSGAERVTMNDPARAADEDPWATPPAGVPSADEAVASWADAQQRGRDAAEDAGRPTSGKGRAAYDAAKAATRAAAEQQQAEREADAAERTAPRTAPPGRAATITKGTDA